MFNKDKSLVTQPELLRLDTTEKEARHLRKHIRDRVLNGALVEPGELCVKVETHRKRSLSYEALRRLIGPPAKLIINALPMVTSHWVLIRSNESNLPGDEPKAVFDPSVHVKSGTIDESPRMSLNELRSKLSTATESEISESDQTLIVYYSDTADDAGQQSAVCRHTTPKWYRTSYSDLEDDQSRFWILPSDAMQLHHFPK